jgi:hypothetical protein
VVAGAAAGVAEPRVSEIVLPAVELNLMLAGVTVLRLEPAWTLSPAATSAIPGTLLLIPRLFPWQALLKI